MKILFISALIFNFVLISTGCCCIQKGVLDSPLVSSCCHDSSSNKKASSHADDECRCLEYFAATNKLKESFQEIFLLSPNHFLVQKNLFLLKDWQFYNVGENTLGDTQQQEELYLKYCVFRI